ncbi:MAG TPA: cytochrome c [Gemmatimonadales bacterium]|jgi:mono/diheme cytochrome c family protein|nr:cytochrome c [Gemmatimonadales bacterium]
MRAPRAALPALLLLLGACDFYYYRLPSPDDLWRIIPWFDQMVHARYIRPYETAQVPRYTPEGTVPVSGGEPDWSAEWTTGKATTANALKNPFPAAGGSASRPGPSVPEIPREVAAAGDTLFHTFCSVCHGPTGNADGTVSRQIGAPSLLTARARGYSDGYIYSIIRYGRGVMPRYGDKVYDPTDRWAIVTHVRKLQAAAPAPPGPPGAAAPVPPGPSATGSTSAAGR